MAKRPLSDRLAEVREKYSKKGGSPSLKRVEIRFLMAVVADRERLLAEAERELRAAVDVCQRWDGSKPSDISPSEDRFEALVKRIRQIVSEEPPPPDVEDELDEQPADAGAAAAVPNELERACDRAVTKGLQGFIWRAEDASPREQVLSEVRAAMAKALRWARRVATAPEAGEGLVYASPSGLRKIEKGALAMARKRNS